MSLRIEPDSRVTIDVLARELGVSQTPIRDALNRMEAEGLVVLHPHVHLFRLLHDTQVTHLAMAEHEEVLAAIAARDPDAAAYAMRRHILLSGERFRRLFDEAQDADSMAAKA
ncbi:GntR family transcriptional regulator [Streptosporangium sp. G11]|uniref:GntR family transcriptional regulator n=1 Tax=Streptosporangium sp. G11 TaxID=3436926 RepID=UPI003EB9D0D8